MKNDGRTVEDQYQVIVNITTYLLTVYRSTKNTKMLMYGCLADSSIVSSFFSLIDSFLIAST